MSLGKYITTSYAMKILGTSYGITPCGMTPRLRVDMEAECLRLYRASFEDFDETEFIASNGLAHVYIDASRTQQQVLIETISPKRAMNSLNELPVAIESIALIVNSMKGDSKHIAYLGSPYPQVLETPVGIDGSMFPVYIPFLYIGVMRNLPADAN